MEHYDEFVEFLRDKDDCFEEGKTEGGDKYVKALQKIDGAGVLTIGFFFGRDETVLHTGVWGIAKIESPMKRDELLRLVNDLNASYNFIKYVVSDDGEVSVLYDVSLEYSFDYEQILDILFCVIRNLEGRDMKNFMRLQWA